MVCLAALAIADVNGRIGLTERNAKDTNKGG